MKYEYLTNTPLDEAVEAYIHVLKSQGLSPKSETVSVFEGCCLRCAADV